jgi:peptide-methionine (S)-S-oxide reductase
MKGPVIISIRAKFSIFLLITLFVPTYRQAQLNFQADFDELDREAQIMDQDYDRDKNSTGKEVATLAGGCFWCLEAVFDNLQGVEDVVSGYSGGKTANPTYHQVSSGATGHAEVIQITFEPEEISYQDLLEVFFTIHDPTTLNRQGSDVGTQYRSAIFYHSPEQEAIAEQVIAELEAAGIWDDPIVTEIVPFTAFYPAEDYHQEYFTKNPRQPYCQMVVAPKVAKFRKKYMDRLKA